VLTSKAIESREFGGEPDASFEEVAAIRYA
jgi:hypothetical protein